MKKFYVYLAAAILVIAIALLVLTFVIGGGQNGTDLSVFDGTPVPQSIISMLRVPDSVSGSIGIGLGTNFPKSVSGSELRINGKPAVIYMGADYCPYCAMMRWGLVVALLRFGNFTGLEYMTSSPSDLAPSSPTFTFANSTYTSNYIEFVGVEMAKNKPENGSYPPLQALNSTEEAIMQRYNPQGGIPFTDFANRSTQLGANYNDPTILDNKNWSVIANDLHNTSSTRAKAIIGSANLLTAEICRLDGNEPASVCGQSYIAAIESMLK